MSEEMNKTIRYEYSNGDIYEGEIKDDLPHGKGKIIENGVVYEGTFIEGIKNGSFSIYPEGNPENKKVVLYNCGHPIDLNDYRKESKDIVYSNYPMVLGKNVGNCLSLTGQVTVIVIFVDDCESSWDDEHKELFRDDLYDSLAYLENSAKEYGSELDFSMVEKNDIYSAKIQHPMNDEFYEEYRYKIRNYRRIAEKAMEAEGTNKTAIILAFNKKFRSYCYMKEKGNNNFEVVFLGAKYPVKNQIAHELLHLFGAQDFYCTEEMKKWIKEYYPISIMHTSSDVFLPVDEVTAYLVGWVEGLSDRAERFIEQTQFVKIRPEQKISEKPKPVERFGLT